MRARTASDPVGTDTAHPPNSTTSDAAAVTLRGVSMLYRIAMGAGYASAPVIPLRQVFLEPHVQDDEEVPAAHLLQLQLRHALGAVAPADRDHLVAVAA